MIDTKDLFLKLLTYYRTGDRSDLDEKVIAIADSEHNKAENHFKRCIDLPVFRGKDYESVRKFLIDWYACGRTIVSLHKTLGDPYSLDYDTLSEYIKSMGFIFPDYIPKKNRATFLLELANLYKIKGSPQSLIQLTKFLDYLDFKIVEYWLVADQYEYDLVYDAEFFYDEEPPKRLLFIGKQIGRMLEQSPLEITYTYDQFREKLKDGHWYHSKREIGLCDNENDIGLPSLTPYFGLFNDQYVTKRWLPMYAIVSRIVKQQYYEFVDHGTNVRSILLESYGKYISILELFLGLWWTFYVYYGYIDMQTNTITDKFVNSLPDTTRRHLCYCLDLFSEVSKQDLWDNLYYYYEKAPENRDDLYNRIQERRNVFTAENSWSILPNPTEIRNLLRLLNNELYEYLYNRLYTNDNIQSLLIELWSEVDSVVGSLDLALSVLSNALFFNGILVLNVINFFKPIHTRLASFSFIFNITDRIGDAFMYDESYELFLTQNLSEFIFHDDLLTTSIEQLIYSHRLTTDDRMNLLLIIASKEYLSIIDNMQLQITFDGDVEYREWAEFYDKGGFYDMKGTTYYENLLIEVNYV